MAVREFLRERLLGKPRHGLALLVLVVSFLLAKAGPFPNFWRAMLGIPGIGALLYYVGQIIRDESARAHELRRDDVAAERALQREERQRAADLTITSHMARVVYDKQSQFCSEYFACLDAGLEQLSALGANPDALQTAFALQRLRIQFSPWITPEWTANLLPIERKLREIGATSSLARDGQSLPRGPERTRLVGEMTANLLEVVGLRDGGDASPGAVVAHLRGLLGVEELTALRRQALASAISDGSARKAAD